MEAVLSNEVATNANSDAVTRAAIDPVRDRLAAATQSKQTLPVSLAASAGILVALALAHYAVDSARVLPGYWFVAGFLAVVAQQDILRRKIPNWLVGPGILLALAYNSVQFGSMGFYASLVGCVVPFIVLIALYAVHAMGAGDVKALMALGTLWGGAVILKVITCSLLIGGFIALLILLFHGELPAMLRRWGRMLRVILVDRQLRYEPPTDGEAAAGGLPFGIAIGLGAAAAQLVYGGII